MKSKRSKATDITIKVRKIVEERDKGLCVICHRPGQPNMHYKRRSGGGLGIPENVVCGCIKCHDEYDFNRNGLKEHHQEIIKNYLKSKYEDWNEEKLIYKKYGWLDAQNNTN